MTPLRCGAFWTWLGGLLIVAAMPVTAADPSVNSPYFGLRVVDADTGRGVPMAELRTVNEISLHTDSAGWAAFHEPGLMNREVFFGVSSPGYEYPADGFGIRGARPTTKEGASAVVKLKRINIAERLYRITGQGIYRDSALLGLPLPAAAVHLNAGVLGQDSVQAVRYGEGIFWLWGDTNLPHYPLGNFQTTAATSPLPGAGTYRPSEGVPLQYFVLSDNPQRVRPMAPFKESGMIWLFGLLTVDDPDGRPALVSHFARMKSLGEMLEHGLVRFNDATGSFERLVVFKRDNKWQYPRGNAVRARDGGVDYFYFTEGLAATRVKADWSSIIDSARYEGLTFDRATGKYRWQREAPPTSQKDERKLIEAGALKPEDARYALVDGATNAAVDVHRCSLEWNAYRDKWVLIACQEDHARKPSYIGEIWYAEADSPAGPWGKAVKVASHSGYSFYNPRQHAMFNEDGGRVIYFEGTYTKMFTDSPPTPRYEYNQMMYRLDLDDARLAPARR